MARSIEHTPSKNFCQKRVFIWFESGYKVVVLLETFNLPEGSARFKKVFLNTCQKNQSNDAIVKSSCSYDIRTHPNFCCFLLRKEVYLWVLFTRVRLNGKLAQTYLRTVWILLPRLMTSFGFARAESDKHVKHVKPSLTVSFDVLTFHILTRKTVFQKVDGV